MELGQPHFASTLHAIWQSELCACTPGKPYRPNFELDSALKVTANTTFNPLWLMQPRYCFTLLHWLVGYLLYDVHLRL